MYTPTPTHAPGSSVTHYFGCGWRLIGVNLVHHLDSNGAWHPIIDDDRCLRLRNPHAKFGNDTLRGILIGTGRNSTVKLGNNKFRANQIGAGCTTSTIFGEVSPNGAMISPGMSKSVQFGPVTPNFG